MFLSVCDCCADADADDEDEVGGDAQFI